MLTIDWPTGLHWHQLWKNVLECAPILLLVIEEKSPLNAPYQHLFPYFFDWSIYKVLCISTTNYHTCFVSWNGIVLRLIHSDMALVIYIYWISVFLYLNGDMTFGIILLPDEDCTVIYGIYKVPLSLIDSLLYQLI